MRRLPPLAAVRVFEAAARHENFTAAGAELAMTQAAVSYQVKLLEDRLGTALFRRERGRVLLTESGRRIATKLSQAFDRIDEAFSSVRADDEAMLTISTSVTFASAWFAWRLGSFQLANQTMGVRLLTSDELVDFAREEVDVGVRSGKGGWDGLCEHLLFRVDFTPMCSPGFLARHGGRISMEQMLTLPWISPDDIWWDVWLEEMGLSAPDRQSRKGVLIETQAHVGHAAMAGQGIAMLTPYFWRNDMAEGRLVRLFDHAGTRGYGYYLVYPEYRRNVPKIRRFREWLLAEVERDRAGEG